MTDPRGMGYQKSSASQLETDGFPLYARPRNGALFMLGVLARGNTKEALDGGVLKSGHSNREPDRSRSPR